MSVDIVSKSKFDELIKFNGFLEKQSPNLFKSWQTRYFMFTPNGLELVYMEDAKSKPKGAIPINEVTDVQ